MEIFESILIGVEITAYLVCCFLGGLYIGEFIIKKKAKRIYETTLVVENIIMRGEYQVFDTENEVRYHIYIDELLNVGETIYVTYQMKSTEEK